MKEFAAPEIKERKRNPFSFNNSSLYKQDSSTLHNDNKAHKDNKSHKKDNQNKYNETYGSKL